MDINKYAADKFKELRMKKNLTQEQLAEELNVTQQQVARYENNMRQFKQDFLFKLAEYFGVSINDFFPPLNFDETSQEINNIKEIEKDQINDLSVLDNVLYTHKDKIDSVKNLPIEKQEIIANAVKSVLDMIDNSNSNQQ